MRPAFYGRVLVSIEDNLFDVGLPATLYCMYLGLICDLEDGGCDASVVDLARRDAHDRLRDWFIETYPHVFIEEFDQALGRRVEQDIAHFRLSRT